MSEIIPEGWGSIPLKEVCFFQEGPGLRNWQYRDHGIKFINIRCIKDGDIDTSVAQHLSSEEVEEKYQHFLLDEGDYVLSSSGTIGRLALVKRRHLPLLLNTSVIRFRSLDDTKLGSLYLRHFLQSRQFFDKISEQSQGSAQVNFGPTHLNVVDAVLPPLPEQKKIASILTSVDEVIENTQKQIDKLQDLKKATMNELLTKGIGHTDFKDSDLGRIPKSWAVGRVSDYSSLVTNGFVGSATQHYRDKGIPYLVSKNIRDNFIDERGLTYISEEFHEKTSKSKLRTGDLLTVQSGHVGSSTVVSKKYNGTNCHALILTRFNHKLINSEFIAYYFNSQLGRLRLSDYFVGSTIVHLNTSDLKKFKIPIPTLTEQNATVEVVKSIEGQINVWNQKLTQTQSLKKSMMQDLLTGKVRVKVN